MKYIKLFLACLTFMLNLSAAAAPSTTGFPADLKPLLAALRRSGYVVKLEKPPLTGAYGLTDSRNRRIWIAPITIDLGILRTTLIHEAVHAAQGCPRGILRPIGFNVNLDYKIEREISGLLYRRYPHATFELEREAFSMQSNSEAVPMLIAALHKRCG